MSANSLIGGKLYRFDWEAFDGKLRWEYVYAGCLHCAKTALLQQLGKDYATKDFLDKLEVRVVDAILVIADTQIAQLGLIKPTLDLVGQLMALQAPNCKLYEVTFRPTRFPTSVMYVLAVNTQHVRDVLVCNGYADKEDTQCWDNAKFQNVSHGAILAGEYVKDIRQHCEQVFDLTAAAVE